jgi:hypothetical protein
MTITNLRKQKLPAIALVLALLVGTFSSAVPVFAVDAPVITTAPFTSSTTPITLTGTATSSATITVTGGADTETTVVDVSGNWSVLVDLNANAVNNLEVTANDGVDTSATSTVAITHDNTAPVVASTTDVSVNASSSAGTVVNFSLPTATDNLDTSVSVVCIPASGTTFASGTTTVTCTASDDAGNTATADFDVIVTVVADTTAPIFATTTDVNATTTSAGGAAVNFTVTATDDMDATVDIECTPASGSTFAVGTTTVTCTAEDDALNTATTTFDVILTLVAAGPDVTAPIFGTTTDVMATATTSAGVIVDFTVTATDDVDGAVGVVCTPASGSLFAVGTTTVTCTAMDNASNTASTTFDVIVDLDLPDGLLITHPIFASGLFCATSTPVLLEGTTDAGATITLTGGFGIATTTASTTGAWSTMINLASNSTSTVLVTITDASDNVIGTTTLDFAFDNVTPTITLNGDANTSILVGGTFSDPGVTVTDNLDANASTTVSGSVNPNVTGTYTITYTATDCAGNTASVERVVNVNPQGSSGGSSSGRRNTPAVTTTANVTGGSVTNDGTTVLSPFNPFQQVLGASAFIPGIPNTGAGGDASTNIALLLGSLGLMALGTAVLRRRSQQTQ